MIKRILFVCVSVFMLASCNTRSQQAEAEQSDDRQARSTLSDLDVLHQAVQLNPLDGYFSVHKPTETMVFILDKSNFESGFRPAVTMNNRPTVVDFTLEKAGAIVLPETPYDTEIILDSAFVENNVMHIIYSVRKGAEARSFTILPVKLFTFDANLDIDSISYENNGVSIVIPDLDDEE